MIRAELWAALRGLRRRPRLVAQVALIVGIGIAGATTVAAVVRGVLQPVPWPNAARMVDLWQRNDRRGNPRDLVSTADFIDWRAQSQSFERLAGWRFNVINLSGGDRPERVQALEVTADYLDLLGAPPALGRGFTAADEREPVVVLSHELWQRRFAGDPAIVGRSVEIDGLSRSVIGVLGSDFFALRVLDRPIDALVPLRMEAGNRVDRSFFVYGLLRAGVPLQQAQNEMDLVQAHLGSVHPEDAGWHTDVRRLLDDRLAPSRGAVELLLWAAGLLLLLVCTNAGNLLLARSLPRRREIAIRIALGASRARIAVMLLLESTVLALLGGGVGVLLSLFAVDAIQHRLADTALPRVEPFRVTMAVAAVGFVLAILGGLAAGLAPALRLSRPGAVASSAPRTSSLLMALQLALAVALLGAGGVTARAAWRLHTLDRGFDPHGVTVAQLALAGPRYEDAHAMRHFYDRTLDAVRALPGVESASLVGFPPLAVQSTLVRLQREDLPPDEQPLVESVVVDRDYFRTLHIALRAGRSFTDDDDDEAHGVVMVDESFVRRFYPDGHAVGRIIRPTFPDLRRFWIPRSQNLPLRIIGVVSDVEKRGLSQRQLPVMYLPYRQNPVSLAHLLLRGSASADQLQRAVAGVDPNQPLFDVRKLDDVVEQALSRQRVLAALLSVCAALAVLIAAIGVFSVTAHGVARRLPEFGIRIALGARDGHILLLVLRGAGRSILAGAAIGLGGAWALCRLLASRLAGIPAGDLSTLALVTIGLCVIAFAAACLPARRALSADPLAALRSE